MDNPTSSGPSYTANTSPPQNSNLPHTSPPQNQSYPPPRLRSPNLFRNIFLPDPYRRSAPRSQTRSLLPPGETSMPPNPFIPYEETLEDVRSAIQSADVAVRNAQEVFSAGRTGRRREDGTNPGQDSIIDLTTSPPELGTGRRTARNRSDQYRALFNFNSELQSTPHPDRSGDSGTHGDLESLDEMEDSPGSDIPSAEREGRRRRQQMRVAEDAHIRMLREQMRSAGADLNTQRQFEAQVAASRGRLLQSEGLQDRRNEDEAVQRQARARRNWERVERRNAQRARLHRDQEQRQNQLHNQQTARLSAPSSSSSSPSGTQALTAGTKIEPVDLTKVDDDQKLAQMLAGRARNGPDSKGEATKVGDEAEEGDADGGPRRTALTGYKCPICMETLTDATTTVCGHLFCHLCIVETLKWSETQRRDQRPGSRAQGACPVCRKPLSQKDVEGTSRGLVPLEIKFTTRADLASRRADADVLVVAGGKDKGKGKAPDRSTYNIDGAADVGRSTRIKNEDDGDGLSDNDAPNKENRTRGQGRKRLKTEASPGAAALDLPSPSRPRFQSQLQSQPQSLSQSQSQPRLQPWRNTYDYRRPMSQPSGPFGYMTLNNPNGADTGVNTGINTGINIGDNTSFVNTQTTSRGDASYRTAADHFLDSNFDAGFLDHNARGDSLFGGSTTGDEGEHSHGF